MAHINYDTLSPLVDYQRRSDELYAELVTRKNFPEEAAARTAHEWARTPLTPFFDAETYQAIPNEFVRCALFGIAQNVGSRRYVRDAKYHVQGAHGAFVQYTGEELHQDDRHVFMELLAAERSSPGVAVIKARQFCHKALGWGRTNAAVQKLRTTLQRLVATAITLVSPRLRRACTVSLIRRIDELDDGSLAIRFEEEVRTLFAGEQFTLLLRQYEARLPKRASLASWLLGFYASHREPQPLSVTELHRLCGSQAELNEFRRMLKAALATLVDVAFLTSYELDKRQVCVVRT